MTTQSPQLATREPLSVVRLVWLYTGHADREFRHRDGTPTNNLKNVRSALGKFVGVCGGMLAGEVRYAHLAELVAPMIGAKTTKAYIRRVVGIVEDAYEFGLTLGPEALTPDEADPVFRDLAMISRLLNVRGVGRASGRVKPVSDEAISRTMPHLPPVVAAVIHVARLTGKRVGELLALRQGDIVWDDEAGCHVAIPPHHKTEAKGGRCVILMDGACMGVLEGAGLLRPFWPGAPLFPSPRHGGERPMTQNWVYQAVRRACVRAGVEHWHPHQIRHTVATLARRHAGLEGAQVLLGHASRRTTERYAETDDSVQAGVLARLRAADDGVRVLMSARAASSAPGRPAKGKADGVAPRAAGATPAGRAARTPGVAAP